jgi:hypothetical protein
MTVAKDYYVNYVKREFLKKVEAELAVKNLDTQYRKTRLNNTSTMVCYSQDNLAITFLDITDVPYGDAYDAFTVQVTIDQLYAVCVTRMYPCAFAIEYRKNGKTELWRTLLQKQEMPSQRLQDYSVLIERACVCVSYKT